MSGENDYIIYADNKAVIFQSAAASGPPTFRDYKCTIPVQLNDVWVDVDSGCVKIYSFNNVDPTLKWQSPGIIGNSYINGSTIAENVSIDITDIAAPGKTESYPALNFCHGVDRTKMYQVVANNDNLYFTKADGSVVLTLLANGNATFANNVTITGDLFADDISYDEETVNLMKVNSEIQHLGNPTNRIAFDTDKIDIDASGTYIVLDDAAMTNKIVINGQTQFVNAIGDVPDIYLQNHIHHVGDLNTRIGFPANDQIELRTGGTNRVLVADTTVNISTALTLNATYPRITANMNSGAWDTRLAFINSNANSPSKLYILPSNLVGASQSASTVYSNIGDLNAAAYNLLEVGQYPTECRFWSTPASGSALPFSWRFDGAATERMRLLTDGSLGLNESNPECSLHISKINAGGNGAFILLDNPAVSTVGNKTGIRFNNNTGASFAGYGSSIESQNVNAGNGAEILTFSTWNGSARGERMRIDAAGALVLNLNSATTVISQTSLSGLTPFFSISVDVDIGASNTNYTATIDSASYIANQSWYCNSVARGYNLNGTLYAASVSNLSQNGITITISGVSASVLRFTFIDTSGVSSTKVGTARITVTSSS